MPGEKSFFDSILDAAQSVRDGFDTLPEPEEIGEVDEDEGDDRRKRQRTRQVTLTSIYRDGGEVWHVARTCPHVVNGIAEESAGGVRAKGEGVQWAPVCLACLARLLIRNR